MKSRLRITCLAIALACWVVPASVEAQKSDKGGKATSEKPVLFWKNGESLAGEMTAATNSKLSWKTPLFSDPVPLDISVLDSVRLNPESKVPDEDMAMTLRDGSRLYGQITGIDAERVTVKSGRHGTVAILRDQVAAVYRIRSDRILWCGPFGEAGWTSLNSQPNRRNNPASKSSERFAVSGPGGSLQLFSFRQGIRLPLELPETVEIEFALNSSVRPEFELVASSEKHSVALTTWADDLVIRIGDDFVPVMSMKETDQAVMLRLFWNRKSGYVAVVAPGGETLAEWEYDPKKTGAAAEATGQPRARDPFAVQIVQGILVEGGRSSRRQVNVPDGISLLNRGPELKIGFLRVREWNGDLPEKSSLDESKAFLETSETSPVSGDVVGLENDELIFRTAGPEAAEKRLPFESVESLIFPEAKAAQAVAKPAERFQYSDGGLVLGRLRSFEDGELTIEAPFSTDPIPAKIDGLRTILFSRSPAEKGEKKETPLSEKDTLSGADTTVHGTWHPAEGEELFWKLVGAAEPVVIDPSAKAEITRGTREEEDWPTAPALFHTENGVVVPGELVAIHDDGKRVEIKSPLTDSGTLSLEKLQAMQFAGSEVDPENFNDTGWQIIRGGKNTVKHTSEQVTIEAGGAWGHPSILLGDEIRFTLQSRGYGTLRTRLFAGALDDRTDCTNLLFAHYGNQIYCGLEESPGELNERRDIGVLSNKPVEIRLSWTGKDLGIDINGSEAIRIPAGKKAPRSGLGLVLEPANLWGNGQRTVTVSNFSLRKAPGMTWFPGVNAEARERVLFIPRFRKADPPHHVLLAPNGDLLRGTIEAATDDRFAFRAGLESYSIPRERVAAAVWLKPPAEEGDDEKEKTEDVQAKTEEKADPSESWQASHWLILTSGARLGLEVDSFGPKFITGKSDGLGNFRIPVDHIHAIRSTAPSRGSAALAFSSWQLKAAPEPVPDSGGDNSPMLNEPAPEILLTKLGGGRFRLSEEKGKIVVLDFWATWCGPCVRALPEMIEAFSQFDPEKVIFAGVNQAEPGALIHDFLEQRGWPEFLVLLDAEQIAGRAYGVEGIPHTVIVDHEGEVAWVSTGLQPGGASAAVEVVVGLLENLPDSSDRVTRILEADDIEDIGIHPNRFDDYLGSFVADLVSEDRKKAVEVLAHAVRIVETSREKDLWKIGQGDLSKTFLGDVMIQLKPHTEPTAWLALQADLLRSDDVPPFELSRLWSERPVIDAIVGADPKRPIGSAIAALRRTLGAEQPATLGAHLLIKVVQRYDGDTLRRLLTRLEQAREERGELSPFIEDVEAAVRTQLAKQERARGDTYPEFSAARYLAALKDDSAPLPSRLLLYDFLTAEAIFSPAPEIVLAGADLIAEAWKGDTPVYQFWAMRGFDEFFRLERDATWKAVAGRLVEGFRTRYLSDDVPPGIPRIPTDDLLCRMLDLYVTTGDGDGAVEIYTKFKRRFADFEGPLIQLVRAGKHTDALKLLRSSATKIGRLENGAFTVFDEDLKKQAAEFLPEIEQPGRRLLVEALIASAIDPATPAALAGPYLRRDDARSQRLQAVAKKFGEVEFTSPILRLRILGILATDVAAAEIVADELRQEVGSIDIAAAIDSRTFSPLVKDQLTGKPNYSVFEGALLLEMASGNVDAANALLDRFAEVEAEEAANKTHYAERIFELPTRAILGSKDPKKTATALIPVCQRLADGIEGIAPREDRFDKRRMRWAVLTFAMAEAGRMNDLVQWLRGLDPDNALPEEWVHCGRLFFTLVRQKIGSESADDRVAYLQDLLSQDWATDGYHGFTNVSLRNIVASGLLSNAEMLEHGEALTKAAPRKGHAWNDLAYIFAASGRLEEAVDFWNRAIEAMAPAERQQDADRYRTNQARALYHAGRDSETKRILEVIDPAEFTDNSFKDLRRQLDSNDSALKEVVAMIESGETGAPSSRKQGDSPSDTIEPDPFADTRNEKKPESKATPVKDGDEPNPFE